MARIAKQSGNNPGEPSTALVPARPGYGCPGSPHRLRHAFATHLVREGVNLMTIRELLGHRQITSTQIYLHMTARDMREAADRHPIAALVDTVKELLPDARYRFQTPPVANTG